MLLLGVLAYFFLMFGNGIVSLTHPDEVFYVQSAKEMLAHHNWWTPIIFDEPHFEKPIFFFWLLALAIKLFGLSPFVARFWPAFFGIVGAGAAYSIAWMLFRRKKTAFLAGFILTSSFIYLALARAVLTDMVFSVWVTISIAFFCWGYQFPSRKPAGMILCWVTSAIAVLTKGILGFIFPSATVLIFLVYKKNLVFLKTQWMGVGALLFFAIVLPWHISMYQHYGDTFVREYFYNVHIRRLLAAEHPKLDNWYFYPGLIFAGILPWSLFWIPAVISAYKGFRQNTARRDPIFFLWAWLIGIFAFVQPAHSKLASYIFPIFPAVAILIASYLDEAMEELREKKVSKTFAVCGYILCVFLAGVAAAALVAGQIYRDVLIDLKPVFVLAALLVSLAGLILAFNLKKAYLKMFFSCAGITVSLLATSFLARPYIEPWVSCKAISEDLKILDRSDGVVIASKFYVRGVRFYTDRRMAVIDINGKGFFSPHPIPFLNTDEKVFALLATQSMTYAIVKEGNVNDLKRIIRGHPYRLEELGGRGGKYIVRIRKI
jgi:4-amino-4-deoxy-L-arabinose transferase-like glycosyltransferase